MSGERGSATIWVLGLSLLLLLFGGLMVDFWRGLALQRELAAVADSSAIAAASGVDEEHYRLTGEVLLSPPRARALAQSSIDFQDADLDGSQIMVGPDATVVTVEVEGTLDLGLLGVLVDDARPLLIRASASAAPRLVP